MKYTLLGSLGHIGSIVAPALVKAGNQVTVISSNPKRVEQIKGIGAVPAIGNMSDVDFLTKQLTGADAVYLMISAAPGRGGSLFDNMKAQGSVFEEAVKQSGIKNVVDLSSIGADNPKAGALYGYHLIEDPLRALSDINVAFVRPVGFYSNLYANMASIRKDHTIYSNIPENVERRWVAPSDIAGVVETLITHVPEGKTIHYVSVTLFQWENLLRHCSSH